MVSRKEAPDCFSRRTGAEKQKYGRCNFADQVSVNSQRDRKQLSRFLINLHDSKDSRHADDLFGHLGEGRNMGFLHAVVQAVDAGMKCGKRYRESDNKKVWFAVRFHKDVCGNKGCGPAD